MMKNLTQKCLMLLAAIISLTACSQHSGDATSNEQTTGTMNVIPQSGARVLVLLAHPHIEKSHMNVALAKAAEEVEGVQVVNIYDFHVEPDIYREAVKNATALVYQFPFYWMSSPHLLKQWTDEVFMAFVQEGLIEGKDFMVVTTTGSEGAAYQHDGRNLYTMEEYLRPFEGQANHAKMHWCAPLAVHGNPQDAAAAEADLQKGCEEYKARLQKLANGTE